MWNPCPHAILVSVLGALTFLKQQSDKFLRHAAIVGVQCWEIWNYFNLFHKRFFFTQLLV